MGCIASKTNAEGKADQRPLSEKAGRPSTAAAVSARGKPDATDGLAEGGELGAGARLHSSNPNGTGQADTAPPPQLGGAGTDGHLHSSAPDASAQTVGVVQQSLSDAGAGACLHSSSSERGAQSAAATLPPANVPGAGLASAAPNGCPAADEQPACCSQPGWLAEDQLSALPAAPAPRQQAADGAAPAPPPRPSGPYPQFGSFNSQQAERFAEERAANANVMLAAKVADELGQPRLLAPPDGGDEYLGAPLPANEEERLEEMCSLCVLDTPRDPTFDDITNLVCNIFKAPIAIVSLVDRERQWFKSVVGLACSETNRTSSFCAWTLLPLRPEVLVVNDALEDVRFRDNALVRGDPFIRFYAGAPLVTSTGMRLGSLCVIDRKPRVFDAESCNLLCNFAEVVVREIEKEKMRLGQRQQLSAHSTRLLRAFDCFSDGIMLVDTAPHNWYILFINDAWARITGISREEATGKRLWDLFHVIEDDGNELQAYADTVERRLEFTVDLLREATDRSSGGAIVERWVANFRPAMTDQLDDAMPLIGIPNAVQWTRRGSGASYYFVTMQLKRVLLQEKATARWTPHVALPRREPVEGLELGPLLGQGAFGKVYRGRWQGLAVAVKVMQLAEGKSGSRPQVELEMAGQLQHPNVVRTFTTATRHLQGAGHSDDSGDSAVTSGGSSGAGSGGGGGSGGLVETWLVMEYCDRGTLQEAVDKGWFTIARGPAPPGKVTPLEPNLPAVRYTAQEVASAMAYLHSRGILHGDLAGGNILLASSATDARGYCAKVADFGLARLVAEGPICTGTYGTVTHMPPELLTAGDLSKAADVYAFGVLLWEMYTSRRPWAGLLQMAVIFHVTIQHKQLEFSPDAPPEYKALAMACMHPQPEQRPTFEQILVKLDSPTLMDTSPSQDHPQPL